jgi:hypothetical protein
MTHSGHDVDVPHAGAEGVWTAPEGGPQERRKSGAATWLAIAGTVAVAGVLGAGSLTGWLGIGDPEVGDCVQMTARTDFDVVECAAAEAE